MGQHGWRIPTVLAPACAWGCPHGRGILGCFQLFSGSLIASAHLVLGFKDVLVWWVIWGIARFASGEADGFWVQPRDGNWGGAENIRAVACGHDFTIFH